MQQRILCVDDDIDLCQLVDGLLADYEVVSAQTKDEAILKTTEEKFDLILLDYQLPDDLGTEICRQIRTSDRETPIIFCTAYSWLSQEDLAAVDAQGVLVKGLHFVDNLVPVVTKILEAQSTRTQLRG